MALTRVGKLLVGTQNGNIHFYDNTSLQLLRTISTSQASSPPPVTFISTIHKPIDLMGHIQLSAEGRLQEDLIPVRPVMPFGRARDVKKKGREISLLLPVSKVGCRFPICVSPLKNEKARSGIVYDPMEDYAQFAARSSPRLSKISSTESEARINKLEEEIKVLKGQLGRARSLNDAMWESLSHSVIVERKVQT
jgi:pre-rRNA-processing protein IPI3